MASGERWFGVASRSRKQLRKQLHTALATLSLG